MIDTDRGLRQRAQRRAAEEGVSEAAMTWAMEPADDSAGRRRGWLVDGPARPAWERSGPGAAMSSALGFAAGTLRRSRATLADGVEMGRRRRVAAADDGVGRGMRSGNSEWAAESAALQRAGSGAALERAEAVEAPGAAIGDGARVYVSDVLERAAGNITLPRPGVKIPMPAPLRARPRTRARPAAALEWQDARLPLLGRIWAAAWLPSILLAGCVVALMYLLQTSGVATTGYDIQRLQTERADWQLRNEQLRLELAKRQSLTWIEAEAVGRLGMVRAEPTALTYLRTAR